MWNLFIWGIHEKEYKSTFRKGSSTSPVLNQGIHWINPPWHCECQMPPTCKPNVFQRFLSKWLLSVHDECRHTETISTHGGLCYIVPKLLHQCSLYASSHFFPENRVTFLSLGILGKAMHAQHFANNFKQFMESVNLFLRVQPS